MALDWKRSSSLNSWAISRTKRWKGNLRISRSVLFWYLRISRRATVPGLKRWGFLMAPSLPGFFMLLFLGAFPAAGALRGAFTATVLVATLPLVPLRGVCLLLAMRDFYEVIQVGV